MLFNYLDLPLGNQLYMDRWPRKGLWLLVIICSFVQGSYISDGNASQSGQLCKPWQHNISK